MRKQIALVFLFIFFISVLPLTSVNAATANISRSYKTNQNIPNGSLVSLTQGGQSVQLANMSNDQNLAGVTLDSDSSLIAVNPTAGTVQVATSGIANVLVSNVNGSISAGDDIAASPFNGVGMKASEGDRIIGSSLTGFNSDTAGAYQQVVTDASGNSKNIVVGYVKVSISIGTVDQKNSSFSIDSLQQFVENLTGKPISVARLLIALVITVLALAVIIAMTYASIYGGVISIGRNPLSKFSIFRTITSVLSMVFVIAIVTLVADYLLLL